MIKTIDLDDTLAMNDIKDVLSAKNSTFLRGEAEFYNEHGDLLFKKSNLIVLGGKLFALEKLFNVKANIDIPDLKTQFNVPPSTVIKDNELNGPAQKKAVCLFCVGKGGSKLEFGQVTPPNFKDTSLFHMIPFRYVDPENDLDFTEKQKYFFRYETATNKIAYFLKKFDKEPKIQVKRAGTDVDADLNVEASENFDVYVEMELKIDVQDIREYFNAINADSSDSNIPRYNEIGLVYGIQPESSNGEYVDYEQLKLFSKLTFNNDALDSVTKELRIIYRVY